MNGSIVPVVLFYLLAALALVGACLVAFSRSIVHSAFALLGTFVGVAGLYALLSADLVAIVQLMVYVGGVLILILFAVMLTARVGEDQESNPVVGRIPGLLAMLGVAGLLVVTAVTAFAPRVVVPEANPASTTGPIGNLLLGKYVLPFEAISVLLLAVLIGAVTIASGRMRRRAGDAPPEGEAPR
jgi:NAD(P)H-quinone oxidoreductase subunit 6